MDAHFPEKGTLEGCVVKGRILAVTDDDFLVDVGRKAEGRVSRKEFAVPGQPSQLSVGDEIEVYVERFEGRNGEAILSRERAKREAAWRQLEECHEANRPVEGTISGIVKGGFTVDVSGSMAFLPRSQFDVRPVKDPPVGSVYTFIILKMDRSRSNIVVSRRSVMEESQAEVRGDLVATLEEGQVLTGVVKNITDYGAFVDLGGIDGLLHVTDMAWKRVGHPSEILSLGQQLQVKVIRVNRETKRISLGIKQLENDPWENIETKFPVGTRLKGSITNVTDYGAFVELTPGVEGLIHVSEMSWSKKPVSPGRIVSISQEVEVAVLDVDPVKRRLSLGLKQCLQNPWDKIRELYPVDKVFEGEIINITDFGLFINLLDDVDGIVHSSDLSWTQSGEDALKDYRKGQRVDVKVLRIDPEKEQVTLGVKQLTPDPFEGQLTSLKKGDVLTCEVRGVMDSGIDVTLLDGTVKGFIKKNDLSRDRVDQRSSRFAVGEKVDAKVLSVDKNTSQVTLSIKARELEEERQVMQEFGSFDSGATLGDILGVAMNKSRQEAEEEANKRSEPLED
jgi:small subunit ribosomal protein S1